MKAILFQPPYANPCSAETYIFQENKINIMAADALAHCVTKSSVAIQ